MQVQICRKCGHQNTVISGPVTSCNYCGSSDLEPVSDTSAGAPGAAAIESDASSHKKWLVLFLVFFVVAAIATWAAMTILGDQQSSNSNSPSSNPQSIPFAEKTNQINVVENPVAGDKILTPAKETQEVLDSKESITSKVLPAESIPETSDVASVAAQNGQAPTESTAAVQVSSIAVADSTASSNSNSGTSTSKSLAVTEAPVKELAASKVTASQNQESEPESTTNPQKIEAVAVEQVTAKAAKKVEPKPDLKTDIKPEAKPEPSKVVKAKVEVAKVTPKEASKNVPKVAPKTAPKVVAKQPAKDVVKVVAKSTEKVISKVSAVKDEPLAVVKPAKIDKPIDYQKALQERQELRFLNRKRGVVVDGKTGLMWMACSIGQKWENGRCVGEADQYFWSEAVNLAKDTNYANYSDWRLPTRTELHSIVDCSKGRVGFKIGQDGKMLRKQGVLQNGKCLAGSSSPTIDRSLFPATPASVFWSYNHSAKNDYSAWAVFFNSGYQYDYNTSNEGYVRLVRTNRR